MREGEAIIRNSAYEGHPQPSALPENQRMLGSPKITIFPVGWFGFQHSSNDVERNIARLWENGEKGTGKNGKFVPNFPIFL